MGSQWSLAAYYRSILMCSVLCQFFLRERTQHVLFLCKYTGFNIRIVCMYMLNSLISHANGWIRRSIVTSHPDPEQVTQTPESVQIASLLPTLYEV